MGRFIGPEKLVTGDKLLRRRDELLLIPGMRLRSRYEEASDEPGAGYRYSAHVNGSKPVHLLSKTGSAHLKLQKADVHRIG
jgi:hypothetical protein